MSRSGELDFFKYDDVFSNWEKKGSQYPSWQEILGELIQNSVKELEFCSENTELHQIGDDLVIDIIFDSKKKLVTISDNGRGMPGLHAFGLGNSPVRKNNKGKITGSGFGIGLNAVIVQSDYLFVKTIFHEETPTDITTITLSGWRSEFGKIVSDSSMTSSQKKASLLKKAARQDETNDGSHFGTDVIFKCDSLLNELWELLDSGGLKELHTELLCRTAIGYTNGLWDSKDLTTLRYLTS